MFSDKVHQVSLKYFPRKSSAAPATNVNMSKQSFVRLIWFKVLVGFILAGVVATAVAIPVLLTSRKFLRLYTIPKHITVFFMSQSV